MAKRKCYCIRCGRISERDCEGWYLCCKCAFINDKWGDFLHKHPSKDYRKLEQWQKENYGKHWDVTTGKKKVPFALTVEQMEKLILEDKL